MKVFFRLSLILLCSIVFSVGHAQNIEISGKVIDAESKKRIAFANIALKEIYKGTASNALGEFSFKVDSLPVILLITHLSFEPLEILVEDTTPLIIELNPGKLLMDELVIKGKGNSEFAYNLVNKAFHKINNHFGNNQYGKAFYRQISKNGDDYSELYEIFYDTKYSSNGVEDWAVQEGRYALKLSTADSFIYNKNFTLMVRLLTIVQPKTEDLVMPVSASVREEFFLTTERIMSVDNRKVAQISFVKKENVTIPAMEGELWIDVESYEVLKLIGTIANDKLKFISLKGKSGSWKDYKVTCEIAFKKTDGDKKLALDYMLLGQNFDYYVDGVFANKLETRSFFSYYEYYTPPKRKKLGGRLLRFNQRDSDILDNIGYNQLFWDENIIVKRTPIEAEVITSFEAERAFGSIYINNKNQIVLEDYELDNDPFIVHVKQHLKNFDLPGSREKVYVHHDKPFYLSGDKLWFSSYLVNMATNIPTDHSDVLHVNLVSPEGKQVISKSFHIENGMSHGQLEIPKDLASGEYWLEGYTDWMKNFDRKQFYLEELEIISASTDQYVLNKRLKDSVNILKLYPEGGTMIDGIPVQLGYTAKNKFGESVNIRGRLLNQEGRMVSNLKNEYPGLGSVFVLPKSETKYRVLIMSDEFQEVEVPDVKNAGYSVMVNNLKPHSIDISVRGTMKLEGKKFYILVISNGILFDRRIGILTRGLFKAEIPKPNLPNGITQILLVDEHGKLQCKRLVFLNQPEEATAKYYFAKKEFKARERVDIVLELNDENGKPLNNAKISVSVLDKDKISRNKDGPNIRSYFNLGYLADDELHDPGALFKDYDRETLKKFDYAMLSQQTVLPEIFSFDSLDREEKVSSIHENGLALQGVAIDQNTNRPLSNGFVTLISLPDPSKGSWYMKTNENGRFLLTDLYIKDQFRVLVKAINSLGEPISVNLIFDESDELRKKETFETDQVELKNYSKRYIGQALESEARLSSNDVSAKVILEKFKFEHNVGNNPFGKADHVVLIDNKYEQYSNMFQVLSGRFPGLSVKNNGGEAIIKIRGEDSQPLIILDGVILSEILGLDSKNSNHSIDKAGMFIFENEHIKEKLSELDPKIVGRVEVIKNGTIKSSLITESGIIVLYTNPGESPILHAPKGEKTEILLPGLSSAEVFVSPNYAKNSNSDVMPDLRSTLYWNPQVITNRRGRAKIGFYNSDEARNLQICIEGITKDGIPVFDIYEIGKKSNRGQGNK